MNNHKSDKVKKTKDKKKVPQIGIELDGSLIKVSPSILNNIIESECINFMLENHTKKDIIGLNDLINVQNWKKKYKKLETQARMLDSIANRLKRDLETDKFAQPLRCLSASVNQHVIVTLNIKAKMARDALQKNSKKIYQIFTISDSEDDVIITDTSNIKSIQTKKENIIDLIDLDNDTQNLETKNKPAPKSKTNCKSYSEDDPVIITDNDTQNLKVKVKPASKSKTNVSIPDLKTNGNNKVLPINIEAGKTLSRGEFLSTTIHKRKPGPKSKTMFVGDMVPFNAENEETPAKKMRLNECEVINNKESNTINLLNCNSVKESKVPEKYFLSLKYPPPYPLIPPHNNEPSWKNVPPKPNMTIKVLGNKVTLTWDLNLTWQTAKIKMYELFVCQESDAPPNTSMWKKKGNIDADLLPMACELEMFDLGHIYYFALRAVDVHDRRAPCAIQKTKI
ncbi:activating transcription factor 7-interacting protein 2-like isoform X2 [Metopolophium dirhodum]|uniref:activating transcription factor 7-interacting protein 2-like isoform X2 n=1 Tax=Metopolophium dirhodum TaxID=44670 RepID=UPI00298F9325|nr:activating transcription factor 7-interacting protein 2-like isoform X2 [Metopolophium dirhodum]